MKLKEKKGLEMFAVQGDATSPKTKSREMMIRSIPDAPSWLTLYSDKLKTKKLYL